MFNISLLTKKNEHSTFFPSPTNTMDNTATIATKLVRFSEKSLQTFQYVFYKSTVGRDERMCSIFNFRRSKKIHFPPGGAWWRTVKVVNKDRNHLRAPSALSLSLLTVTGQPLKRLISHADGAQWSDICFLILFFCPFFPFFLGGGMKTTESSSETSTQAGLENCAVGNARDAE